MSEHSIPSESLSRPDLPLIIGLDGSEGRKRLLQHPASVRAVAYDVGVLCAGENEPQANEWEDEARRELTRLALSESALRQYCRRTVGSAYREHEQYEMGRTDPLTGLPNRRAFYDEIEWAIKWGKGAPRPERELYGMTIPAETRRGVLFAMVDIDYFKDINDVLGHDYGDQVIVRLGRALNRAMRGGRDKEAGSPHPDEGYDDEDHYPDWGTLARLGGDEFGLIIRVHELLGRGSGRRDIRPMTLKEVLDGADQRLRDAFAQELAEINQAIREHCRAHNLDEVPELRVSMGVHQLQDGDNEAIIMRKIDQSMYDDKRRGKARDAYQDRGRFNEGELETLTISQEILRAKGGPRARRVAEGLGSLVGRVSSEN